MTFEDVKRIRENPTAEDCDNKELARMIDLAIEKQIPKKPKIYNNVYPKDLYECPDCQCGLRANASWKDKYCCNCGLKLDWSDTE